MTIEPGQSERCRIVCARVRFREICFQTAKKKKIEEEGKKMSALDYVFFYFQVFIFCSCGQVYVFVCLLAFSLIDKEQPRFFDQLANIFAAERGGCLSHVNRQMEMRGSARRSA